MERAELLRMTRTRLIEEAMKIPDITGAHGMTKEELIRAIAKAHGVDVGTDKGTQERATMGELKREIRNLKNTLQEAKKAGEKKPKEALRKKLKRLKHRTRVLAGQVKSPAV